MSLTPATDARRKAQRDRALKKANDVRVRRGALHRDLETMQYDEGLRVLAQMIGGDDPLLKTAKIGDVLIWPYRMGQNKALTVLRKASNRIRMGYIGESRRVGSLTPRERDSVVSVLCEMADKWEGAERRAA